MAFAIMRLAKIKQKRDLIMAFQHNSRERIPENSNSERISLNQVVGGTAAECTVRFDGLLPKKVRKDAVLALELVFTASPGFSGDWTSFLKESRDWGLKIFGIDPGKKDIRPALQWAVHNDESTPHLHLIVMPLKDGKLNAKHFCGGHRDRMVELQNNFYEQVGKKFGMERGISKSETKAKNSRPSLAIKAAELEKKEKEIDSFARKILQKERELKKFDTTLKGKEIWLKSETEKIEAEINNLNRQFEAREKKLRQAEDQRAQYVVENLAAAKNSEQIAAAREMAKNVLDFQKKEKQQEKGR